MGGASWPTSLLMTFFSDDLLLLFYLFNSIKNWIIIGHQHDQQSSDMTTVNTQKYLLEIHWKNFRKENSSRGDKIHEISKQISMNKIHVTFYCIYHFWTENMCLSWISPSCVEWLKQIPCGPHEGALPLSLSSKTWCWGGRAAALCWGEFLETKFPYF